jgi:RNA recognition motif-containing protein
MRLYVGNIPWSASEDDLRDWFSANTDLVVESVKIILDRDTGRSRGFGFVDVNGIFSFDVLNQDLPEMMGRPLKFLPAHDRQSDASKWAKNQGGNDRRREPRKDSNRGKRGRRGNEKNFSAAWED